MQWAAVGGKADDTRQQSIHRSRLVCHVGHIRTLVGGGWVDGRRYGGLAYCHPLLLSKLSKESFSLRNTHHAHHHANEPRRLGKSIYWESHPVRQMVGILGQIPFSELVVASGMQRLKIGLYVVEGCKTKFSSWHDVLGEQRLLGNKGGENCTKIAD